MKGERARESLSSQSRILESLPLNSRRYQRERSCRSTDHLREKTLSTVRKRLPRSACWSQMTRSVTSCRSKPTTTWACSRCTSLSASRVALWAFTTPASPSRPARPIQPSVCRAADCARSSSRPDLPRLNGRSHIPIKRGGVQTSDRGDRPEGVRHLFPWEDLIGQEHDLAYGGCLLGR